MPVSRNQSVSPLYRWLSRAECVMYMLLFGGILLFVANPIKLDFSCLFWDMWGLGEQGTFSAIQKFNFSSRPIFTSSVKNPDYKYCNQPDPFCLRPSCKKQKRFIRMLRHNSHLLMKAAQRRAVIISCQMGFLCVWFKGFDYNGRIYWKDYISAGKKIDGTAYSS